MTKKTKVSIIITAEKKENYIERAIKSCINQSYNNIETIVVYTELTNNRILKKKFSSKKIKFLNIRKKLKIPTQDQLFKIYKSLKFSKGQYIFLMDGDDAFQKNKISSILKNKSKKKIMYLDNFKEINNKNKKIIKMTRPKRNKIYRKLINSWPKGICTSCISIDRALLIEFFKKIKIKNYKYLAVDALLTIYFSIELKFFQTDKILTKKYNVSNSVDDKFTGIFNKFFWLRRLEQHHFYNSLTKNQITNLDLILTKVIYFFIKK